MSDASGAWDNDYNISHLGLFGLDILVIILLYLQNVVALAYIGTDNQFIPENDEFNSDDENVVQIEGESKQAAKLAKMKAKEQRSTMNLVNAFCEAMLEDPKLWRLPTSDIFRKTVTAISANPTQYPPALPSTPHELGLPIHAVPSSNPPPCTPGFANSLLYSKEQALQQIWPDLWSMHCSDVAGREIGIGRDCSRLLVRYEGC